MNFRSIHFRQMQIMKLVLMKKQKPSSKQIKPIMNIKLDEKAGLPTKNDNLRPPETCLNFNLKIIKIRKSELLFMNYC